MKLDRTVLRIAKAKTALVPERNRLRARNRSVVLKLDKNVPCLDISYPATLGRPVSHVHGFARDEVERKLTPAIRGKTNGNVGASG